jgi:hypothetical protein
MASARGPRHTISHAHSVGPDKALCQVDMLADDVIGLAQLQQLSLQVAIKVHVCAAEQRCMPALQEILRTS